MRRREFIRALGSAAMSPLAASAQKQPARIGLLASGAAGSIYSTIQITAIHQGLREAGLTDGRDYLLEPRFAAGNYSQFPELARDLAGIGVRVILANTIASVHAAQGLRPVIPVVMISINDPVGAKLVNSLSQPGGYTTGLANLTEDLTIKLFEFQRTVVPNASTVAVLYNPLNSTNPMFLRKIQEVAGEQKLRVVSAEFKPGHLDDAISSLAAERPDALHVLSDSGIFDLSDSIAAQCLAHHLPSFATYPDFATLGGLLAYGTSRRQLFIRSGYFVRRILEGAQPGDLPIEQPTRIQLAINLKTAKALDLQISPSLLSTADEVVE